MRKLALLVLFYQATPTIATAQVASDSVRQVIYQFFDAMRNTDTAQLRQLLTPNVIFQTIRAHRDGTVTIENESVDAFLKSIASLKAGQADERIEFSSIQIDNNLATVWTPYQFYFNGEFSHCGVNSFTLVNSSSQWKIHYIVDTRRKLGCLPSKQ